jgi:8-oxo-dGTP pyrophosphatase MutT (NUDIX family)
MREKSLSEAAAQEAFEEAGVQGRVDTKPIGHFDHTKNHLLAGPMLFTILVFPLEVSEELADWPEREQRSRRWFARAEALAVLQSNQLRDLIRNFQVAAATGRG